MNPREWKGMMADLVGGVESRLRPSAPKRARERLAEFRARVATVHSPRERRRCEIEVETFLQSTAYLRRAAWGYLTPKAAAALRSAADAEKMASAVLIEYEARKT